MSQYLDKDGASRIAENFLSKQAEQDAILQNLQFDLKEAEHALVKTIQGPAPLNIRALTRPLDDYDISGNILQNGTPTPQAPVDVVGCGVRTENLLPSTLTRYEFAIESVQRRIVEFPGAYMYIIPTNGREYFTLKIYNPGVTVNVVRLALYDKPVPQAEIIEYVEEAMNTENPKITIHNVNNSPYLIIQIGSQYANQYGITGVMLNFGSTPLPYEPYGYKIPITCGGVTTPIYLGQVPTTRRIKKLVLDGTESSLSVNSSLNLATLRLPTTSASRTVFCTHYKCAIQSSPGAWVNEALTTLIIMDTARTTNTAAFRQFLASQYDSGTPVTVWYVLATPETAIVNEPLHKIGNYADTISYAQAGVTLTTTKGFNTITTDTTVLPSNIEVKGVINNA